MDLLRDSALDVFDGEVPRCGVSGFDDVEEVGVCGGVEEGVGGCELPGGEPVGVEVCDGVWVGGGVVVRKVMMVVVVVGGMIVVLW